MQRVESLDVLRGLAASYVVLYHTLLVPPLTLEPGAFARFVQLGGLAVPLFFALSALSMLLGYHDRLERPGGLRLFYVRRAFRIFPLFWFALLLHVGWRTLAGHPPPWSDVWLSAAFLFPFVPGHQQSLVMAGWSLGIEWVFYAMFPMFLVAVEGLRRSFLVLAATAFVAAVSIHEISEAMAMSVVKHAPAFVVGAVIYFSRHRIARLSSNLGRLGVPAQVSATALFLGGAVVIAYAPHEKTGFFLVTLLAWLLMLSGACVGFPRLITNRYTEYLGRISYSLYLMHPLVLVGLIKLEVFPWIYGRFEHSIPAYLASFLLVYAITLLVGSLTYRLIEQPGQALGRALANRRIPWRAPVTPPPPTSAATDGGLVTESPKPGAG